MIGTAWRSPLGTSLVVDELTTFLGGFILQGSLFSQEEQGIDGLSSPPPSQTPQVSEGQNLSPHVVSLLICRKGGLHPSGWILAAPGVSHLSGVSPCLLGPPEGGATGLPGPSPTHISTSSGSFAKIHFFWTPAWMTQLNSWV